MFVGFGLLVVIALFTALIAPYFIDWTAYKQDFEKQASRIIGQKVTVSGEAGVRILPLPSISFTDLAVGETANGEPMMTVSRFNANVELMPFLSGEIRIVDMSLDNPIFNLEVDQAGKIAWTERQEALVDPRQVKLDRLTIKNAEFNLIGLSPDRTISGRGIDADVSAQSLYGPWRISGSGEIDGQESRFAFSTGQLSDDNSIRLKADLERADRPYELKLDGQVSLENEILSWIGTFGIDPFESKQKLAAFKDETPLPVRIEGNFGLSPTRLDLPAFAIDVGSKDDPFSLSGKGAARLKGGIEFRLEIDGRQVDLNRIAKMRDGEDASANTLETRLNLFRDVLGQIPVPAFSGEIDLEIPAIIAGDTFIREVSALIKPFGNGWEIARLKTSLPGNTLVEAKGRLGKGDEFGFHGDLLIASRQPSGFAAWAAGAVDPAIRKLSSAGLSANVILTPGQINLDQMELILDQNRLTGSVRRLAPSQSAEEALPAIVANLDGDDVRLDDLRAVASLFAGEESFSLQNDFDISLKAETLSAFELSAENVDLQFQYKNSELSIGRLNLDNLLGTSIKSVGQITNFLERPRGNMSFEVNAKSLQTASRYIGEKYGWVLPLRAFAENSTLSAGSSLKIEFDSRPVETDGEVDSSNRVIVTGKLGETSLMLRSGFKGTYSDLKNNWIDASLEAFNANGEILLKQMGFGRYGFVPIQGEMSAPLKVNVESVGSAREGYSTILSMNNDVSSLSAKGSIGDLFSGQSDFDFDVTLGSSNIAPLVYSFGHSLPGLNPILGDEAPFSSRFKIASTKESPLSLDIQKGQIYGNAFSGELALTQVDGATESWTGDIELDHLSLDVLAALASGEPFIDELGNWSEIEFQKRPFADQSAKLNLTAKTVDIGAGKFAKNGKVKLDVSLARVFAQDLGFDWKGTNISGNATLSQSDGSLVLNSQLTALDLDAEAFLQASAIPQVLEGQGNVTLSLDGEGKSPRALIGALSGSGVAIIEKGKLHGVQTDGLENILTAADVEDFEISAQSVVPLSKVTFLNGITEFENLSAPFSLSNGTVQFRNIAIDETDAQSNSGLSGDFQYSLLDSELKAFLRVSPAIENSQISGSSPDIGFSWAGKSGEGNLGSPLDLTVDTNSLEGFLSVRAFEIEQRRVETLQANILEKQRFRYELLKSNERSRWLEDKRLEAQRIEREAAEQKVREEAERLAKIEEERLAAEATAKAQREAEEAARLAAEEEARQAAEKLAAEEAAAKAAEEEAARVAAENERLAQEEVERLAQEKRDAQAAIEAERAAAAEAEHKAAEQARQAQQANQSSQTESNAPRNITPKQGFEARPLPAPNAVQKPNIFKNIEQLLFQK